MFARLCTVAAAIACAAALAACGSSGAGGDSGSGPSAGPVTAAGSSAGSSGPASAGPVSSGAAAVSSSAGGTGGAAGSAAPTGPPPAPSTSAPATIITTAPGIFVGTWDGHSRRLMVSAAGTAKVDYRLYVTCSPTSGPPCDKMVGNSIIDGGHVTLHVVRVVTAHRTSTATATVTTTSDPAYPVGSTQTFKLVGDIIDSRWGTFCDAKAGGQCGA
jgi:hypothetical protein